MGRGARTAAVQALPALVPRASLDSLALRACLASFVCGEWCQDSVYVGVQGCGVGMSRATDVAQLRPREGCSVTLGRPSFRYMIVEPDAVTESNMRATS